jgi:flagellar basal-body rod protein FlgB
MIDPIFQSTDFALATKLLDAAALRQDAIAANMANVETPGYHRVDVSRSFAAQLRASVAAGENPATLDDLRPSMTEDKDARSVRPDGNNVELEKELLAMNQNSVEYSYLTEVVSTNIKQLKTAINGTTS